MSDQIIPKRPSSPIATTLLAVCCVGMIAAISFIFMELKELKVGDSAEGSAKAYYGDQTEKNGKITFKKGKDAKIQKALYAAMDDAPAADEEDDEGEDEEDS